MTGALGHAPPPSRPSTVTAGRLFVFLVSLGILLVGWSLSFSMAVFTAGEVMYAAFAAALHFLFLLALAYIVGKSFASKFAYRWSAALLGLACCIPLFVLILYSILIHANMG